MNWYIVGAIVLLLLARSVWTHRKRKHEYHVVIGSKCIGHIHSDSPIVLDPRNDGIFWIRECTEEKPDVQQLS